MDQLTMNAEDVILRIRQLEHGVDIPMQDVQELVDNIRIAFQLTEQILANESPHELDDVIPQLVEAVRTLAEDLGNPDGLRPPERYVDALQRALSHQEEMKLLVGNITNVPIPNDFILDVVVRTAFQALLPQMNIPFKVQEMEQVMKGAIILYMLVKGKDDRSMTPHEAEDAGSDQTTRDTEDPAMMITDEDVRIALEAAATAREGEERQAKEAGRLWTSLFEDDDWYEAVPKPAPKDPYDPPVRIFSFDNPIVTLIVNGLAMIAANQQQVALGNPPPYTEENVRQNLSMLWEANELCEDKLSKESRDQFIESYRKAGYSYTERKMKDTDQT